MPGHVSSNATTALVASVVAAVLDDDDDDDDDDDEQHRYALDANAEHALASSSRLVLRSHSRTPAYDERPRVSLSTEAPTQLLAVPRRQLQAAAVHALATSVSGTLSLGTLAAALSTKFACEPCKQLAKLLQQLRRDATIRVLARDPRRLRLTVLGVRRTP